MSSEYFDVWKKRMIGNGGSETQSRLNNSKSFIDRNFKNDPSYKLATLRKRDNNISDSDLDTRVVNVDTNTKKKKIYVRPDTNIEVGDYIIYPNKTYLALEVEDNLISPYASATECNHEFKWMYKGILHKAYGIGTNQTKYTLGTDAIQAGLIESDSRYAIDFPNDLNCKTLKVGQRLIFNDNAWKVTQVEYVSSQDCIRSILFGQDSINTEIDNLDLEIAGYYANKHTYTYNIPTSFEVSKDSTYQLNYSIKDETDKDFDCSLVTVTTTNNTLAQITNTNGVITIKGLGIGIGTIKLSIPSGETSKEFNISFEVKSIVVDKIEYGTPEFSNGTSLKIACSTTIKCTKYLNGIAQDLTIEWELDSVGQGLLASKKIAVINKSNYEVQIKNLTVSVPTNIGITIRDNLDKNVILNGQVINLIK